MVMVFTPKSFPVNTPTMKDFFQDGMKDDLEGRGRGASC